MPSIFRGHVICCISFTDAELCRYLKVAAAVAIIRTKPPSCDTGRQHAEQLQQRYQGSVETWRTRAEGLQDDVLLLKQRLILQGCQTGQEPVGGPQGGGCIQQSITIN